ncbi:LacI family DNA-binding transcriptional regulator [Vibrio ulleungensis]|uniref:Substrate-binding domain-containing protein n=1 Tax=Vibrio ulleungensis TaxID=2807619 RepID=A0ABS2HL01_9VIBR|nr:substrate-binding domain-containing protein [Vibrio ulleungensis]MBM7037237.1 substrate-binding domain-containing protein [Vibrio ulleungensis]
MHKKATIYDVAKHASVSPATVSRYLNRTSFITKEKVDAIETAIFELGFRPRKRKNQPSTKRNMLIGVVAPSYDTSWVSAILEGMSSRMHCHSYDLIVETTQWKLERERMELQDYVQRKVDGIIVLGGFLSSVEVKQICGSIPVLFMSRDGESGDIPVLNIDNELGGYLATNHLIQKGHRKIAHVCGPQRSLDARERLAGYKRALKSAGIAYDPELVGDGHYDQYGGFWQAQAIKKKRPDVTAMFVANDLCAFGAIQALHQMGIAVPKDVSVVGFDDVQMADYYIPRLTTIRQPFFEIGELAINYILDIIGGNDANYEVPAVSFFERESTRDLNEVSWSSSANRRLKNLQRPKVS